jgi:hypothetical protein
VVDIAETTEEFNELWNEMIDCLQEVKNDMKDNRRARRHIRNLEQVIHEIGQAMVKLSGKKGFLR